LPDDKILNVADSISRNARTTESLLFFLLFNLCNNCLFVQVSNNEIFDFFTRNLCLLNFC